METLEIISTDPSKTVYYMIFGGEGCGNEGVADQNSLHQVLHVVQVQTVMDNLADHLL
jgi:hypothetical protein